MFICLLLFHVVLTFYLQYHPYVTHYVTQNESG